MQKNSFLRNFLKFGRKSSGTDQTPAIRRIRRNTESDFDEFTVAGYAGSGRGGRLSAGLNVCATRPTAVRRVNSCSFTETCSKRTRS